MQARPQAHCNAHIDQPSFTLHATQAPSPARYGPSLETIQPRSSCFPCNCGISVTARQASTLLCTQCCRSGHEHVWVKGMGARWRTMRHVNRLRCSLRRIFILLRTYFGWKSLCRANLQHVFIKSVARQEFLPSHKLCIPGHLHACYHGNCNAFLTLDVGFVTCHRHILAMNLWCS